MPVTREKLYEEVWAEPMTTVAKRYGVSGGFLAGVCERLGIPRPVRGHWQQLAVGCLSNKACRPLWRPAVRCLRDDALLGRRRLVDRGRGTALG
jgi:hypothetical protein